jgi:hypothetical protein
VFCGYPESSRFSSGKGPISVIFFGECQSLQPRVVTNRLPSSMLVEHSLIILVEHSFLSTLFVMLSQAIKEIVVQIRISFFISSF